MYCVNIAYCYANWILIVLNLCFAVISRYVFWLSKLVPYCIWIRLINCSCYCCCNCHRVWR